MGTIALRRTKAQQVNGRPLVALPDKTVHQVAVQLDAASRAKYERWQAAGERGGARRPQRGVSSALQGHMAVPALCPALLRARLSMCCFSLRLAHHCGIHTSRRWPASCVQGGPSWSVTWRRARCCRTTPWFWRCCSG